jgi:hypothetical protein
MGFGGMAVLTMQAREALVEGLAAGRPSFPSAIVPGCVRFSTLAASYCVATLLNIATNMDTREQLSGG